MSLLFLDQFTASDQPLTTYNPAYIQLGSANTSRIVSNRVFSDDGGGYSTNNHYYRNDHVLPYNTGASVQATVASTGTMGNVTVEYVVDANNRYAFQYGSGVIWLRRIIGGVSEDAGSRVSVPFDLNSQASVTMRLEVDGQELRAYWDDMSTPILTNSSPSNSITSSGYPGFSVTSNAIYLDDFQADDGQGAAQVPQDTVVIDSITNVTDDSATVNWSYPGSDITHVNYTVSPGSISGTSSSSPINLTGLPAETLHTVVLEPENATGVGTGTATDTFTTDSTPVSAPSNAPSNIQVTETLDGCTVTFTGATGATSHNVSVDGGASTFSVAGTSFSITGQTEGSSHSFTITGHNSAGLGPSSAAENYTTLTTPPVVSGVRGDAVASTGTHGPSVIYSSLDLPTEDANIFRAELVNAAPAGLTFNEDGTFTWSGLSVGTHDVYVNIFKDDVQHVNGFFRVIVS